MAMKAPGRQPAVLARILGMERTFWAVPAWSLWIHTGGGPLGRMGFTYLAPAVWFGECVGESCLQRRWVIHAASEAA